MLISPSTGSFLQASREHGLRKTLGDTKRTYGVPEEACFLFSTMGRDSQRKSD